MADEILSVQLTLLDRLTQPLRAVNARLLELARPLEALNARFDASHERLGELLKPAQAFGHQLSELGENLGLARVVERTKELGEHLGEAGRRLGELFGPLAALGAAAGAAGLVEMTRQADELGEQLKLASIRTGLTTEALSALHFAASRAGADAAAVDMAMGRLNRTMAEAVAGKNKDALALFVKLGFSPAQLRHMTASQMAPALFEAFEKNVDPGLRERMAKALFGRSGGELIPFFAQGRGWFDEMTEKAKQSGMVISGEEAERLTAYNESWKDLASSVQGLSTALSTALGPALDPVIKSMTLWLNQNRDLIGSKVISWLGDLNAAVKAVGWTPFIAGAGLAAAVLTAPLTLAVLNANKEFAKLGYYLGAGFLGKIVPSALLSMASLAESIGLTGLGGALLSVGGLLEAAPLLFGGLVIASAAAALYMATHWEETWEGLKTAWGGFSVYAAAVWHELGAELTLMWSNLKADGIQIWGNFVAGIAAAWSGVTVLGEALWHRFTTNLSGIWDSAVVLGEAVWRRFGETLGTIWGGLVGIADGIWQRIKAALIDPMMQAAADIEAGFARIAHPFAGLGAELPSWLGGNAGVGADPAASGGPAAAPIPRLYGPGGAASRNAADQATSGRVDVGVTVTAPPGTSVKTTTTGRNPPTVDVGRSYLDFGSLPAGAY